jgi:hypothetical protein
MLDVRTVIVLGAGASAPYGFPTGFDLSGLMVNYLQPGSPFCNHFREATGMPIYFATRSTTRVKIPSILFSSSGPT